MNQADIRDCTGLIKKLKGKNVNKDKIRNELFLLLREPVLKWMGSILRNRNHYSETEMISLSWDCFLFCLKYYKSHLKIPVPNHFYAYTKFFLLTVHPKKHLTGDHSLPDYDLSVFEDLDDLKEFKKALPKNYALVFDDALMSMSGCRRDRIRRIDETFLKYYQYHEAKKIMKYVIIFLLRR